MARPRLISDEQILETMRSCVMDHGPAVSLEVVAGRLKVTAPALLKRFGSRQALFLKALLPPEHPRVIDELSVSPDERPLPEQLEALLGHLWDYLIEIVPCIAALRESGIPHKAFFNARRDSPLRYIKLLTHWLERAKAKGLVGGEGLETAATAMLGSLQIRIFTAHITKQSLSARSRQDTLRDLTQFFTHALAPSTSHRRARAEARST